MQPDSKIQKPQECQHVGMLHQPADEEGKAKGDPKNLNPKSCAVKGCWQDVQQGYRDQHAHVSMTAAPLEFI